MSMYYYFFINILLTILAIISLALLKTSPFRVRFRIVLIALCSWLIPYDYLYNILSYYPIINVSLAEYNDKIRQVIVPQLPTVNHVISLGLIFTILSIFGVFIFVIDLIKLTIKLKNLKNSAIFYKNRDGINCYCATNINAAFSSGFIKPVIWFDKKYVNHPNLDSLLQHELQHIKQFDHLWLLVITFIQRIMWWNPLVIYLSKKSRALIELSCDQSCANKLGKET